MPLNLIIDVNVLRKKFYLATTRILSSYIKGISLLFNHLLLLNLNFSAIMLGLWPQR